MVSAREYKRMASIRYSFDQYSFHSLISRYKAGGRLPFRIGHVCVECSATSGNSKPWVTISGHCHTARLRGSPANRSKKSTTNMAGSVDSGWREISRVDERLVWFERSQICLAKGQSVTTLQVLRSHTAFFLYVVYTDTLRREEVADSLIWPGMHEESAAWNPPGGVFDKRTR